MASAHSWRGSGATAARGGGTSGGGPDGGPLRGNGPSGRPGKPENAPGAAAGVFAPGGAKPSWPAAPAPDRSPGSSSAAARRLDVELAGSAVESGGLQGTSSLRAAS